MFFPSFQINCLFKDQRFLIFCLQLEVTKTNLREVTEKKDQFEEENKKLKNEHQKSLKVSNLLFLEVIFSIHCPDGELLY